MALSLRRKYRPLSFLFPSLDPISVPSSGLLPCGLRREDKGRRFWCWQVFGLFSFSSGPSTS